MAKQKIKITIELPDDVMFTLLLRQLGFRRGPHYPSNPPAQTRATKRCKSAPTHPKVTPLPVKSKRTLYTVPNLRAIRERKRLTPAALARQAGVCVDTILSAENGCQIQRLTLNKLADALQVSPDRLCVARRKRA